MIFRSLEEWDKMGYQLIAWVKSQRKNDLGVPLYSRGQVVKKPIKREVLIRATEEDYETTFSDYTPYGQWDELDGY